MKILRDAIYRVTDFNCGTEKLRKVCRYHRWIEKPILCRNCALHILPKFTHLCISLIL